MKIAILVEGKTEMAFKPHLLRFLETRLPGKMPKLDMLPYDGRIPTGTKLKRIVVRLLEHVAHPVNAVIALTDVYTGSQPPEFENAEAAKSKMRGWVGYEERFFPHVAVHDFEAWLLPYWSKIQTLAGSNRAALGADPEKVDHGKPPAHRLAEVFRTGQGGKYYVKTRDASRILRGEDLLIAANACSELKAFLNTILGLCDEGKLIP